MLLFLSGVIRSLWSNPSLADTASKAPQKFATFDECRLTSEKVIVPCRIGYRTNGALNDANSNAILIQTWLSTTSDEHAYLASPKGLNPEKYFIVIIDVLTNGVAISPLNSDTQPNGDFPQISITDMVVSQHRLLIEALGIHKLHGIMHLSISSMQTFKWAVRYPRFVDKTVALIGSPRLPAFDIALGATRNVLLALYRKSQSKEPLKALAGMVMIGEAPTKVEQEASKKEVIPTYISRSKSYAMVQGKSVTSSAGPKQWSVDFYDDMTKAAAQI